MTLAPKQARYLQRFFPGLIAEVEKLAPGEFVPELPKPRAMGQGLGGIELHLTYLLNDNHDIQIRVDLQLKRGQPAYVLPLELEPVDLTRWERNYYRLHYGKHLGDCIFRFDLDVSSGHHVHMISDPKVHVASNLVEPDVRNLDPRKFIQMVAAYRSQGTYPIRKKKP